MTGRTPESWTAAHNDELPDDIRPVVRIGIALGEVLVTDSRMTGEETSSEHEVIRVFLAR